MKLFNFPAAKNTSNIVLVLRTASLTGKALDNLRRELRALATAALTLAGVATAWSPRDPQHIDAFLKANITQGETVLADFKTYYALRANGSRPLLPTYLPAIRPEEQSAVTALIIKESDASAVQSTLGGAWQPTGATPPPPPPGGSNASSPNSAKKTTPSPSTAEPPDRKRNRPRPTPSSNTQSTPRGTWRAKPPPNFGPQPNHSLVPQDAKLPAGAETAANPPPAQTPHQRKPGYTFEKHTHPEPHHAPQNNSPRPHPSRHYPQRGLPPSQL